MQWADLITKDFAARWPSKLLKPPRPPARTQLPRKTGQVSDGCRVWKELRFHQEYDFNLQEYIVELEKPIGLTLAPDLDGNVYVVKVHKGSPAEESKVIMEGDVLRKYSPPWGDSLLDCSDLRHALWAIQKRKGKVKLMLEHQEEGNISSAQWHRLAEMATFAEGGHQEWTSSGHGRCMVVSFRRTALSEGSQRMRGFLRAEKAAALCADVMEALDLPSFNLSESLRSQVSEEHVQKWDESNQTESSNLVPYRRVGRSSSACRPVHNGNCVDADSVNSHAKLVTPVLPWLLVSNSRLSQANLVDLAGRCGLQCLLEMQLEHCKGGLAMVRSCWRNSKVDAFIAAVGALHRLVRRRNIILRDADNSCKSCNVLLHCDRGMEGPIAGLIAAYCYLYGWTGYEESIELAEMAMQAEVPKDLLEEATEFLKSQAIERHLGVTVSWRYGGAKVEVAGDLVGGWMNRSPLRKAPSNPSPCQSIPQGTHFLRLTGLQPGLYNYKFIVDGNWQVDFLGPTAMDKSGNWNNVLLVDRSHNRIERKATDDLVRVEAALVALRTKRATA